MSINNYKKSQNYSGLLGDVKASSLNDKIKGRNYKMQMKRAGTNSVDHGATGIGMGVKNTSTSSNYISMCNDKIYEKTITDSSVSKADKRIVDKRKLISGHMNDMSIGNKIDIKISVNYGKPGNSHTIVNSGSSNLNTNVPSLSSSTSKSKSFYQSSHNNFLNASSNTNSTNVNNSQMGPDYLGTNQEKVTSITNQLKEKLIKSLKTPPIVEENNHKRNQSEINYFHQNNSNSNSNSNHSFAFNQHLMNHVGSNTPKRNDTLIGEKNDHTNNCKTEPMENAHFNENLTTSCINNEFTLNRNDNNFLQAVTTVNNNINSSSNNTTNNINNKSQILTLETKMEDLLSSVESENEKESDKMLLHSKKYYIFKKIFDDYLKVIKQEGNFARGLLGKINEGYNDTLQLILMSYSKAKEKFGDYETMAKSYKNVSVKYNELYKAYSEKSEEVKILKNKLAQYEAEKTKISDKDKDKSISLSSWITNLKNLIPHKLNTLPTNDSIQHNQNNQNNQNYPGVTATEINELSIGKNRSRVISMITQNAADDIDSICFFDKINMRSNTTSHSNIPKLDLNFLNMNMIKKKKDESSSNLSHNMSNNNVSQNAHKSNKSTHMSNLNIKKMQPLKLEDLSNTGDNSKLIASKYQSLQKSGSLYTNCTTTSNVTNSNYLNLQKKQNNFDDKSQSSGNVNKYNK